MLIFSVYQGFLLVSNGKNRKNSTLISPHRKDAEIYYVLRGRYTMNLNDAELGNEYIIKEIATNDEEMTSFLFSLGCYSGEPITVVTRKKNNCVVSIKDARYNIDKELAAAIII